MSERYEKSTFYVQLRRHEMGRSNGNTWQRVRVVTATQTRPTVTDPDVVVVKLTVNIPAAAFEPLMPSAEIEVPLDLVQRTVLVEAGDPE